MNDLTGWPLRILDPTEKRDGKPRKQGITMVIDKGLGLGAFADLLALAGEYIDYVKLGFGTSVLYPRDLLKAKIDAAKSYNVKIYPGGTLLEAAVSLNCVDSYLKAMEQIGFDAIEISDGTISIPADLRRNLIKKALAHGFDVITEYGKKRSGSSCDFKELENTLHADLEAGASYVIVEGRESGQGVGIYDQQGNFDPASLSGAVSGWALRDFLIWEAPRKKQQSELISLFGPNVNLGNIASTDVVALEALRRGLRSDTFFLHQLEAETY